MKNFDNNKWIHFIGIAGVATGQIAVEFKNNGYKVTGSDKGLFPPLSTHLKSNHIEVYLGYKKEHLEKNGKHPDIVVVQGTKGSKNPEYLYAKELDLDIKTYPEILKTFVLSENSIVVAGTYGKTTTTAMLAHIFEEAYRASELENPPSYMFGGLGLNFENGVKFNTRKISLKTQELLGKVRHNKPEVMASKVSILEGDEYFVSKIEEKDQISKFFLYNPKYLILTSAQWDHTDIFPTKEEYLNNFKKLIEQIPEDGIIIYNSEDLNVKDLIANAKCKTIEIEKSDYNLQILGEYNQLNAAAAAQMAKFFDISESTINKALESFKGIKRRLEVRFKDENELKNSKILIIDDFGASPPKAKAAIKAIRNEFNEKKIIVVFEPNLGSRTFEGIEEYKDTFNFDNISVFLPRFSRVKGKYIKNTDLKQYLETKRIDVAAIDDDDELINQLTTNYEPNTIYLFLGSHSFRGIIEKLIEKLKDETI